MNNDTRKYIAETLRLIAVTQLVAFGYTAFSQPEIHWAPIGWSVAATLVLLGIGVRFTLRITETS